MRNQALSILLLHLGLTACAGATETCRLPLADILARHQLERAALDAPATEVTAQQRRWGGMCFGRALDRALGGLLSSTADAEAPLAIAAAVAPGAPCPQPGAAERLRCYLQAGGAIGLLRDAEADVELLAEAWVFYLEAPALSDHVFWAEVSRIDGRVAVHGGN